MATLFNNTEITNAFFNGTELDKIYFNGVLVFEKGGKYKRRIMVGDNLKGKILYFDGLTKEEMTNASSIMRAENLSFIIETLPDIGISAIKGDNLPSIGIYPYLKIKSIGPTIYLYDIYNDELETYLSESTIEDDKDYIVTDIDWKYASFAGGDYIDNDGFLYRKFYIEDENIRPLEVGDNITNGTILYFVIPDNFYENITSVPPTGLYTNIINFDGEGTGPYDVIHIMNYCNSPSDVGMMINDGGKGGYIYRYNEGIQTNLSKYTFTFSGVETVSDIPDQYGFTQYIFVDKWTLGGVPNFAIEYISAEDPDGERIEFEDESIFKQNIKDILKNNTEIEMKLITKPGKMTDCSYLFSSKDFNNPYTIKSLDLTEFDTSNVTNMTGMFEYLQIKEIDVSNFDTSNVRNLYRTFSNLRQETFGETNIIGLDKWNIKNVTNLAGLFFQSYITENSIKGVEGWDTSNVTSLNWTFARTNFGTDFSSEDYNKKVDLNLSNWNTAKVTDMFGLFESGQFKSLNLSNWNTAKVKNFKRMFENCHCQELDVSEFNISSATNMDEMFSYSSEYYSLNLKTIYCSNDWAKQNTGASSTNMFKLAKNLVGAVAYNDSKVDISMANPTTGYFTNKNN